MATSCEELTHWKRPWCWEGLRAGGEGDDRGWDGWMASPTHGHGFEQALGVGDGQGGLACCGHRVTKNQARLSNWTERNCRAPWCWISWRDLWGGSPQLCSQRCVINLTSWVSAQGICGEAHNFCLNTWEDLTIFLSKVCPVHMRQFKCSSLKWVKSQAEMEKLASVLLVVKMPSPGSQSQPSWRA